MKRIISILLAGLICMSLSVGVFAEVEKQLPDNFITIVNTLQALDILGETELSVETYNQSVSRGAFASHLLKLIRMDTDTEASSFQDLPKSHPYYSAVGTAQRLGFLEAEGGRIRPDDAITYGEAVKAAAILLGADANIVHNGSRYVYYISLAKSMRVLRAFVSAEATATFAQVAELLYNTLLAETVNTLPTEWNGYSNISILESCWGLNMGTGFVTANRHYSLSGAVQFRSNQLLINGRTYSAEEHVDIDCVGLRVKYFYDDNGTITVLEKEEHDKLTISSRDMISFSGGNLRYFEASGKEKSEQLAADAYILVNYEPTLNKEIAVPVNGDVTLLDYDCDGTYDVAFVNDYIEIVANFVDQSSEIISGKGGKTARFDWERVLVYVGGARGTVADIVPGSTLSVCCGTNGVANVIYVSNEATEGMVTEISEDSVSIRGRRYVLSRGLDSRVTIKAGDSGTFYINHKGEVAFYVSGSTLLKLGYLMGVAIDDGISQEVLIRVLTQDNEKAVFPLRKKITYNGASAQTADIAAGLKTSGYEGSCEQVIRYGVDSEGMVYSLETAAQSDSGITLYSDRLHLAAERNGISGILDGATTVGAETVEFIVPEIPGGEDGLYRATASPERGSNRKFKAYNLRKYQYAASAIVHYANVSEELNYDELPAMVSKVVTALNTDGEVRKKVTLMQSTGWPSTIKEFTYFVDEAPLWETVSNKNGTAPQCGDNVNVGDMILYAVNERNEIVRINRIYNGQTQTIDSAYGAVTEVSNSGSFNSEMRLRVSYPFMSEENFLIASKVPITSQNPSQENLEYYEHYFEDVLIVERRGRDVTMRKGTMADIRTYENYGDACDKVLIQTKWSWLYNVVAIRSDV